MRSGVRISPGTILLKGLRIAVPKTGAAFVLGYLRKAAATSLAHLKSFGQRWRNHSRWHKAPAIKNLRYPKLSEGILRHARHTPPSLPWHSLRIMVGKVDYTQRNSKIGI